MNKKHIASLLFLFISFFLLQSNASAHAYITNSTPVENESLDKAPKEVKIEFNEKIQSGFTVLNVLNSAGERVDKKDVAIDKQTQKSISVTLKNGLKNDVYTVEWRILSADGHSVSGMIPFSIGELPKGVTLPKQQYTVDKSTMIVVGMNKAFLYTGLCLYMGLCLFYMVWFRTDELASALVSRTKKLIYAALSFLTIGIISFLMVQTQTNTGMNFLASLRPGYLLETIKSTKEGTVWIIQMLLLLVLWAVHFYMKQNKSYQMKKSWIILGISIVGIILAKAFIGHPSSSPYDEPAIIFDFFHLTGASIWLGGIIVIVFLLKEGIIDKKSKEHHQYWHTLQNYSHWALFSVAILAVSGAINASLLIPDFHSLVSTAYGVVLLVKVGLFFVMIGFGAYHLFSRLLLSRKKIYKTSIKAEMFLGILILLTTAVFTQLQTPTLPIDKPFYEEAELGYNENISLSISPKKTGVQNEFDINLFTNDRKPMEDVEQLSISLSHEGQKTDFTLKKTADGKYSGENLKLNQPGKWEATVHVLTKDFDSHEIPFSFQVR
ncbi:copper resistance CopC/CopD family protein [Niallia sp. NCCP-28]|uniref:copper resistance CopC/CopD family protein n=1 Tax=Niallia sp. NCCP-28 TaxID=2934712 RepID=UPI002081712E|nr:copper resistance CopC/CopD family protein [Niallia sp. NCCP-28]GKU84768.1 copper transport protein YcnJ [Niallia sp. NCCP-28]